MPDINRTGKEVADVRAQSRTSDLCVGTRRLRYLGDGGGAGTLGMAMIFIPQSLPVTAGSS